MEGGHLSLPPSLRVAVLLCGTNNMHGDKPQDIAEEVIVCGLKLQEKAPKLHGVVTGILPGDLHPTPIRERVQQTNSILKQSCWTKRFSFIKPSPEWVSASGKEGLYYSDHLHLVGPGNKIIAKQMARIISVALAHNNEPPKIVPPVVLHNHSTVRASPARHVMTCMYQHKPPLP